MSRLGSTPNYGTLAAEAIHSISGHRTVFAGQRLEGFYVDGAVFDLDGRWYPDRDPETGQRVGDRQHQQVLPVQRSVPRQPPGHRERRRRDSEHHRPHNRLGRLVRDRHGLSGPTRR